MNKICVPDHQVSFFGKNVSAFELLQEGIDQKGLKQLELDLVVSFMFGVIHEMVKNAYFTKKKLTGAMVDDLFLMFWDAVKK